MSLKRTIPAALSVAAAATALPAFAGKTLDAVKARGQVVCGVNTSAPGFSAADSQGRWSGLDVDFCRGVAAAVLGDAAKVKFVPLNSQQRFAALQAGEIDVLSRNTTWTLTRDASLGIVFTGINYYDGQGFMVPKKLNIDSAKKLNGATVCVQAGTTSEKNVADFFAAQNMKYKTVVFDTAEAITGAFFAGRCQVYTTDMSDLAGARTTAPKPDDFPRCAAATTSGSRSCAGSPSRCSTPRRTALRRRTSTRCAATARIRRCSVCSERARTPASCSAWRRSGPTASSSRSATTARASNATSARSRRSRCRAA
jgi:ABC-type amino acid transport substrate-binding protein